MANVSNFSAATAGATVSGTLTDSQVVQPQVPTGLRADGPRVTFHFITEPWDSGNTYVYYDVVKDSSGASWICKYPQVPAGTPLEEGSYWTRWADPNIEVEELREIVKIYDSRIKTAEKNATDAISIAQSKPNVLIIGDSWSDNSLPAWHSYITNFNIHNYAISGAAYLKNDGSISTTFTAEVESSKDIDADYVIVFGGLNDIRVGISTPAEVGSAAYMLSDLIKQYHPNATQIFGLNVSNNETIFTKYKEYEYYLRFNALSQHSTFINSSQFLLPTNLWQTDTIHPTEAGQRFLANCMQSVLTSGNCYNYALFNIESVTEVADFNDVTAVFKDHEIIIKGKVTPKAATGIAGRILYNDGNLMSLTGASFSLITTGNIANLTYGAIAVNNGNLYVAVANEDLNKEFNFNITCAI